MTCKDELNVCTQYANQCDTASIGGIPLWQKCLRTCNRCKVEPLRCNGTNFICQNGGICQNTTVASTSLFGFQCSCPTGFSGELCEKSKNFNNYC